MVTNESTLDEVLSLDPCLINIADRFHLPYKNTQQTIRQASQNSKNNPDFVVEIMKAYADKDYFPQQELNSFNASTIIDYLIKTHNQYIYKLLPQMEQSILQISNKFRSTHDHLEIL